MQSECEKPGVKFLANVIIKGKIKAVTGLLVGGVSEEIRIGKIDATVIRDPTTNRPYIPGSSLKGKMRTLLEYYHGKVDEEGDVHNCDNPQCEVCRPFGSSLGAEESKERNWGPTRVIIRDALLSEETARRLENLGINDYTEIKGENVINRLTSQANPRFFERVPAGSDFDFEMTYMIFDTCDGGVLDVDMLKQVLLSMHILEDVGIGRAVTRGYGKVLFEIHEIKLRKYSYYEAGSGEVDVLERANLQPKVSVGDLLKRFDKIKSEIVRELES